MIPSSKHKPEVQPEPEPEPTTYGIRHNAIAKWGPRKWFLSHVCDRQGYGRNAVYQVYCPIDNKTKSGLKYNSIRPLVEANKSLTRAQMVKDNVMFYYEGDDKGCPPSTWKVRAVNHKTNEFRCVRIQPESGPGPNIDNFSVGYVMGEVISQIEHDRERGPTF